MKVDKVIEGIEKDLIQTLKNMDYSRESKNREEYFYNQGIAVGLQRSLTIMSLQVIKGSNTEKKINDIWSTYTDLIFKSCNKIEA